MVPIKRADKMNTPLQNRNQSYQQSLPLFNPQEQKVIDSIRSGNNHAWAIQRETGLLITSVRRSLHDLSKDEIKPGVPNPKKKLQPLDEPVYYPETNRRVTAYKIVEPIRDLAPHDLDG